MITKKQIIKELRDYLLVNEEIDDEFNKNLMKVFATEVGLEFNDPDFWDKFKKIGICPHCGQEM